MDGIAVSLTMFLIKGIPEGFLVALCMHFLLELKVDIKKYIYISLIYVLVTYLIRFLPITLGINTIIFLFVMIYSFQAFYHIGFSKMVREVISALIILVFIAVSEALNFMLLVMLYGPEKANELVGSTSQISQALYTMPSTVFLAIFTVICYFIIKIIRQIRMKKHGKDSEETR